MKEAECALLPGIASKMDVNGRNAIRWEEKFCLDIWYVNRRNLRLNTRILAMTFGKVILREGISAPGEITAKQFMGSDDGNKSS